ncbi:MAG: choice-of-anchor J domain-containing protein [Paludibacteraceae bacterium]
MKKQLLFSLMLLVSVGLYADYFPVNDPNVGDGRLVVCAQNVRNYFVVDLAADRPDYHDQAGLTDKTDRIVRVFRHLDADIYALCEMECQDSTVAYLTNALNTAAGTTLYAYVKDNQNVGGEQIKAAFIYRKDKVKPYGDNIATSTQNYYRYTMRLQAFEELSTGERFVLSMNHFKAKDTTEDQGNAKREKNATDLISKLQTVTYDPDILIMGDLNCTIEESPLQYIVNAGYTEVLLEYNPDAYSHYFSGYELIDHAFANGTMKAQIKGADAYHINTGTGKNSDYWYSDHDPVLVSLSLYSSGTDPDPDPNPDGDCTPVNYEKDFKTNLDDYIVYTPQGSVTWLSNASYGAVINGYNKTAPMESWLISPAFDLRGAESATIAFRHNIYYDNTNGKYADYQTLWYTTDYDEASPASSTWHQLTIPDYAVKKYVNTSVSLPVDAFQSNFRFAFKYTAESGSTANYWEIDNVSLTSVCPTHGQAVEQAIAPADQSQVRKFLQDGTLYIQVGTTTYTLSGYLVR